MGNLIKNNGDNIKVYTLKKLFNLDISKVFSREIPIRQCQNLLELKEEHLISFNSFHLQIQPRCKLTFLSSFQSAVYNAIDYTKLET